ncbi:MULTISPECIES: hypothetical protein [Chromobacterium]|uniref:Uncharacterized protein n=1 Tax=Chromobacterium aquaticum TaxID=467180 RepID=A0ABV8ZVE3_9NEIS|nr:hypothetical protein [Chromobacterium aquaticum]
MTNSTLPRRAADAGADSAAAVFIINGDMANKANLLKVSMGDTL